LGDNGIREVDMTQNMIKNESLTNSDGTIGGERREAYPYPLGWTEGGVVINLAKYQRNAPWEGEKKKKKTSRKK